MSTATGNPVCPIRSSGAGDVRGLHARITELNAELSAERDRERSEKQRLSERFRSLYQALPAAIIIIDGSGRVQDCNPGALALFGERLDGELWREVVTRLFEPLSASGHELVMCNGRVVTLSTAPLGSEPGQILLFQEVTETYRLREALSRHQRLAEMGRMAASLAHQIRTPLASALLYASHLDRDDLPDDKRHRFSRKAVASLHQLERLINDMLLFARGGAAGEESLRPGALLQELCSSMAPVLSESGTACRIDDASGERLLRGNRTMLLSALQNLVTNAIQAMGNGGRVELLARPAAPDGVDLLVRDNGPGIAHELQGRLFEPFETTRAGGTGLGLAVVRAIARAHRGDAWMASEPGQGSTFALRLPCAGTETVAPDGSTSPGQTNNQVVTI